MNDLQLSQKTTPCAVNTIASWDEVTSNARLWNELGVDNFMLSTFWLGSWWQAFGENRNSTVPVADKSKLAVGRVEERSGKVLGFIPGFVSRTMLGRTYRLLGSGNVCSDYMRLLSQPSFSPEVAQAAADWFNSPEFRQQFGRLDAVEIEGQTEREPSIQFLAARLEAQGWKIEQQALEGAWRLPLPTTWDIYEKSLHKSRRRKVNKAKRLLSDGTVRYTLLTEVQQMEKFWPTFVALHQKRREALGQEGCFADKNFFTFLYNATQRMLTARRCWISVLLKQGEAVAANLLFTADKTAFMYQSGMDMDHADLEPGHLINTFSIQSAIERGFEWFDFLRGDEPYKEGWNGERAPLFRMRAFAPHLSARLRQTAIAAGRSLRAWTDTWSNLAKQ